jgi:hypothetical protein
MDSLVAVAVSMILLHRSDGGEVAVTPSHITALHAAKPPSVGGKNKLVANEARCVIWLDDGKLLAVLETCDAVKKLLGEPTGR